MRALLMGVAALALAYPLAAQEVPTVEEPSSGVPFPMWLDTPAGQHIITGTGIRTRTFLKVKVYAFGLYVDSAGAVEKLASFNGQSHRDLERSDEFYEAILEMDFAMTLRLVMTRDVGAERMADAFDGALRPRVEQAAAEMNMPGGVEALDTFRNYFSVEEMVKESELIFTCTPDGTLSTHIRDREEPDIQSPALCWALFDVYLGEDPISGDGKKKVTLNFPAILAGM